MAILTKNSWPFLRSVLSPSTRTRKRTAAMSEADFLTAIQLLRAWTAGCGDEHFSTKEQCRDLIAASGQFLAKYPSCGLDDPNWFTEKIQEFDKHEESRDYGPE